jgi:2-dehydro-3-deoxyphosphogluconate aldolase/(4S)-4-hydroxy-2-oxoglutarate aldolase
MPNVLACGGSWMVKQEMISAGKFDEIREMTARAVEVRQAYGRSGS